MANEPENVVLVMLRRMDEQLNFVDTKLDRVLDDVHDLKVRMTSVEEGVAGVNRRLDRIELRVDRIESRLDISEAAH